jgi:hypothetical protein
MKTARTRGVMVSMALTNKKLILQISFANYMLGNKKLNVPGRTNGTFQTIEKELVMLYQNFCI